MHFKLEIDLTQKVAGMERTDAIRMMKEKFDSIGCCPDLATCRDLIDKIQRGQVSVTEGLGWNLNYILVRLGD